MTGVVALASAGYSKLIQLVMTAFQAQSPAVLWWGPLGVIGLSCANAVGQYFKEITGNRVTNRMETELRKTMFARLVGTDLARLQTEAPAGLAARFSSDIGLVGSAVRSMLGGVTGILTIVVTFAVMLTHRLAADGRHLPRLRAGAGPGQPHRPPAARASPSAPRPRWPR